MTRGATTPATTQRRARQRSPELMATLAKRLTGRDRYVLRMLYEHRVLTTGQIDQLAFGNHIAARHRMLTLHRLGVTDRFRPFRPHGSAPWHYILAPTGAWILAAEHGTTVTDLGYRHDHAIAIAHAATLGHTVSVNGFFTALAAHARAHPECELRTWWSQRRCAHTWGDLARPDAYGHWREHGTGLDFFLEYDTGTEPLRRVAAKLDHYHELAQATRIHTPVLFWLPSPARETNLRPILDERAGPSLPVATATPDIAASSQPPSPAAALWLPLGQSPPRRRLAELGRTWPSHTSPH